MKPIGLILLFTAGAVCGAATTALLRPSGAPGGRPAQAAAEPPRAAAAATPRTRGTEAAARDRDDARLMALVRKVAELEKMIAAGERADEQALAAPDGRAEDPGGRPAEHDGAEAAAGRLDYLTSIDVNGMGRQERRSLERLRRQMARKIELDTALSADGVPDDERAALAAERAQLEQSIGELRGKVRRQLLTILAGEIGLAKEDAKAVVGTIGDIIDATD